MAWAFPAPATTADSSAFSLTTDVRASDPFTASNLTWTEVVASTSEEWAGFVINLRPLTSKGIFAVATGGAASETIVATVPTKIGNKEFFSFPVPVAIPAGTRVAVASSGNSSNTVDGQIVGIPSAGAGQAPPYTRLDCGPFDLSGSFADYGSWVTVDPGGTANTKGGWTEISYPTFINNVLNGDSIAQSYDWFGFMFSDNDSGAQQNQNRLWDIATGASSSEVAQIENIYDHYSGTERGILENGILWIPADVAAGSRISARMQSDIIDATDRIGSVIMFGLRT